MRVRRPAISSPRPSNLTFEQSAAVGDSALTALAAVRDQGKVQPGQTVLINGASGGVGTFAVQIAKAFGANVTGVCSTASLDMVRSLGADQVIDYTREDFVETGQRYDVMLDLVGSRSLSDCRRALTRRGTYVVVGVKDMGRWLGSDASSGRSCYRRSCASGCACSSCGITEQDLADLKELVEAGKLMPVIDRRYPLAEVPEALRHQGEGHPEERSSSHSERRTLLCGGRARLRTSFARDPRRSGWPRCRGWRGEPRRARSPRIAGLSSACNVLVATTKQDGSDSSDPGGRPDRGRETAPVRLRRSSLRRDADCYRSRRFEHRSSLRGGLARGISLHGSCRGASRPSGGRGPRRRRRPGRARTRSWSGVTEASVGQRRRSLQTISPDVIHPAGLRRRYQPMAVPNRCPMP